MPALSELSQDEREWLCDTIAQLLTEENTDEILDVVRPRLEEIADEHLPGWLSWVPFLDPVEMVVEAIDKALPGLVRDPVLRMVGCPNVEQS